MDRHEVSEPRIFRVGILPLNAQKPKESEKKYKLNPTGSQGSKQKKQNLVVKSKGHFCDGFGGRGSDSERKEQVSVIPFCWLLATWCGG